jgi:hypothetical protein
MANAGRKVDELQTLDVANREAIGSAIIKGLISPAGLVFEKIASEGGDYNQSQGDYTQSGGGDHNQGGGGYNQSKSSLIDRGNVINVVNLAEILKARG